MRASVFAAFLILFTTSSFSQLDNSPLFFNENIDTTHERVAYLKIQNLNFMKNNEYSGPIADGYTLFGFQLNPQVGYKFTKELSIEGGVFLNKDFGNDKFTQVLPTFTLRYYKKDFRMIFGNIDGSVNHQLIEPLYNFERVMNNRLESGAQFVINKKYFNFDAWINWLSMTYKGSNSQEKLLGGLSCNVLKLSTDNWEFKLPFQSIVVHHGGQLDTLHEGSTTDITYAAGIVLKYLVKSKNFESVYVDARYVDHAKNYYYDNITNYDHGSGLLANIGLRAFKTDLMFSYWNGDNFYNEFGGFLYSSKSSTIAYPNYSERYRELLIMRLSKKISLAKYVNLLLRIEPYYDMKNKWFEYSYGLYISLDERIWLEKKTAVDKRGE